MDDVDPAHRFGGAAAHGRGEPTRFAREREDAAVMIGVGVDAEQPRVERRADRLDRGPVAAFGDIGDREQRDWVYGWSRT
jgi:hypothetical protein